MATDLILPPVVSQAAGGASRGERPPAAAAAAAGANPTTPTLMRTAATTLPKHNAVQTMQYNPQLIPDHFEVLAAAEAARQAAKGKPPQPGSRPRSRPVNNNISVYSDAPYAYGPAPPPAEVAAYIAVRGA